MKSIYSLVATFFLFASVASAIPTEAEIASDGKKVEIDSSSEQMEDACMDTAEQGEVQCREWAWFGEW